MPRRQRVALPMEGIEGAYLNANTAIHAQTKVDGEGIKHVY
jgi:hypothetical protein